MSSYTCSSGLKALFYAYASKSLETNTSGTSHIRSHRACSLCGCLALSRLSPVCVSAGQEAGLQRQKAGGGQVLQSARRLYLRTRDSYMGLTGRRGAKAKTSSRHAPTNSSGEERCSERGRKARQGCPQGVITLLKDSLRGYEPS
eukprot:8730844-Pyramimonas_sp.AAC.1